MSDLMEKTYLRCSFCGKKPSSINRFVEGSSSVFICKACISLCSDVITSEEVDSVSSDFSSFLQRQKKQLGSITPRYLFNELNRTIIGQDYAKKVLSVAVFHHYQRIIQQDYHFEKSNILLAGPTGCGKTSLVRSLAQIIDVPCAISDATSLTETGYVGEDVESVISTLYQASDNNVKRAEQGIVYIDEIDKIARKSDNPSLFRDISGEGVQQALLKIIEGSSVSINLRGKKISGRDCLDPVHINTRNILFILGGSFVGIDRIISKRIKDNSRISFVGQVKDSSKKDLDFPQDKKVTHEDLRLYGFIPELTGRIGVICPINDLTLENLKEILLSKNTPFLEQYKRIFNLNNVQLIVDDECCDCIVKKVLSMKIGARGLRSILEDLFMDAMFRIPSEDNELESIRFTKDCFLEKKEPIYFWKKKK